jgi:hypothetical protein
MVSLDWLYFHFYNIRKRNENQVAVIQIAIPEIWGLLGKAQKWTLVKLKSGHLGEVLI